MRILVAPLDWGLGHLTRCVPLIRHLRARGHTVIFAGDEHQRSYINAVLPELDCLQLEGYKVRYAKSRVAFMPVLLGQLPRLLRCIRDEHRWLQRQIREQRIDAVLSDNRYGLYSRELPCVFLTHQLQVRTGLGTWADRLLRSLHYRLIRRFSACWVPDLPGEGISGLLGHPPVLPRLPLAYIGWLSQCTAVPARSGTYLLVLLSGTEPQRSQLAALIWKQLDACRQEEVIFVEGSAAAVRPADIPDHVRWYGRVAGEELAGLIAGARLVVCRSGYSSLMDLLALKKQAVLIPTPGQTEQEYLAVYLAGRGCFSQSAQAAFRLDQLPAPVSGKMSPDDAFDLHHAVLDRWLNSIQPGASAGAVSL